MAQRVFAALLGCALLTSCTSLRKISQTETRLPAGAQGGSSISPLREKFLRDDSVAAACPAEIRELLPVLSEERVKFSVCPELLPARAEAAQAALRAEERTAVEEILAGQCRNLYRDLHSDALNDLIQNLEPAAVQRVDRPLWNEQELRLRQDLREALLEVRQENGPLENWVRLNGEFVIGEEPLNFLSKIVSRKDCRMNDDEVDASYRALRGLEDLTRLLGEAEPQRAKIDRFLLGVHKVVDQKIKEFFRP